MTPTRRRLLTTALAAGATLGLGPVLKAPALRAQDRLNVVATTGMIADAARFILGDAGEVRALMGPGVDPHAFRQTRSDIVAM
ncbi:MAG: zinc ABC transporter substrate-binding protein, partial [Pseudomonadota bacterium]|nr:zinc ABC transporter substrate-binding protein [Pseudomonadota bacterium]